MTREALAEFFSWPIPLPSTPLELRPTHQDPTKYGAEMRSSRSTSTAVRCSPLRRAHWPHNWSYGPSLRLTLPPT